MTTFNPNTPSFESLLKRFNHRRDILKVGNNTEAIYIPDNETIAIKYHQSIVGVFSRDTIAIDPCGWYTLTTKVRLNWILGDTKYRIYQKENEWYLYDYQTQKELGKVREYAYLHIPSDSWNGLIPNEDSSRKEAYKQIREYVNRYMEALLSGKIESPNNGDCFYCRFGGLPDSYKDHIESHIKESYFVPSLLVKAIQFKRVSHAAQWVIQAFWYPTETCNPDNMKSFLTIAREQIYKSLIAYMQHCYTMD